MSREQVMRAINELEELIGNEHQFVEGANMIGGGGPRKRKPGRPKRTVGSGIVLAPAPFGYGRSNIGGRNIGGCNIYGAGDEYIYGGGPGKGNRTKGADRKGGRKATHWNAINNQGEYMYGIRERSKLLNRDLNNQVKANPGILGNMDKTSWKIYQIQNNPYVLQDQKKYMIDKYEVGQKNIVKARDALLDNYCPTWTHPGQQLAPAPVFTPVGTGIRAPSHRGQVAYYPTAYIH